MKHVEIGEQPCARKFRVNKLCHISDESEEVEKKCQAVIREMEKTLGEPLQKYF